MEAVYDRSISKFRKALSKAQTQQEAVDAWMAFIEDMKEVNFKKVTKAPYPGRNRPLIKKYFCFLSSHRIIVYIIAAWLFRFGRAGHFFMVKGAIIKHL